MMETIFRLMVEIRLVKYTQDGHVQEILQTYVQKYVEMDLTSTNTLEMTEILFTKMAVHRPAQFTLTSDVEAEMLDLETIDSKCCSMEKTMGGTAETLETLRRAMAAINTEELSQDILVIRVDLTAQMFVGHIEVMV